MNYYTTYKQNLNRLSTAPWIRDSLGNYQSAEGQLTYVRGHGKMENHVTMAL